MRELIVDGYNVIHAWPELKALIGANRGEDARRRLTAMLGEYAAATGEHVTVVFDAHGRARDRGEGERVDGVTVLFGSRTQSADHVIERRVSMAAARGDAGLVTVASGDRLQRDMVMAMGASVISADSLRQIVLGMRREVGDQSARRRREAHSANRLEDRLSPTSRRMLEQLRRPPTEQ